jgi:hypothetical protein
VILDPATFHGIAYVSAAVLLYTIAKDQPHSSRPKSLFISIVLPAAFVVASQIIIALAIKPTMAHPRSHLYAGTGEPWITALWHRLFGAGPAFPSGAVTRQVVLTLIVYWLANHEAISRANPRSTLIIFRIVILLLIPPVIFVRLLVGSHNAFEAVAAIPVGVVIFWILTLPFLAVFHAKSADLITHLAYVWLAFTVELFFYALKPFRWALIGFVVFIVLSFQFRFLDRRYTKSLSRRFPGRQQPTDTPHA